MNRGQIKFARSNPTSCAVTLIISYEVPDGLAPFASVSCDSGRGQEHATTCQIVQLECVSDQTPLLVACYTCPPWIRSPVSHPAYLFLLTHPQNNLIDWFVELNFTTLITVSQPSQPFLRSLPLPLFPFPHTHCHCITHHCPPHKYTPKTVITQFEFKLQLLSSPKHDNNFGPK